MEKLSHGPRLANLLMRTKKGGGENKYVSKADRDNDSKTCYRKRKPKKAKRAGTNKIRGFLQGGRVRGDVESECTVHLHPELGLGSGKKN